MISKKMRIKEQSLFKLFKYFSFEMKHKLELYSIKEQIKKQRAKMKYFYMEWDFIQVSSSFSSTP